MAKVEPLGKPFYVHGTSLGVADSIKQQGVLKAHPVLGGGNYAFAYPYGSEAALEMAKIHAFGKTCWAGAGNEWALVIFQAEQAQIWEADNDFYWPWCWEGDVNVNVLTIIDADGVHCA